MQTQPTPAVLVRTLTTVDKPMGKTHRNVHIGNQQWEDGVLLAGDNHQSMASLLRDLLDRHIAENAQRVLELRQREAEQSA